MRIAIYGSGGVGGYFGARLAQAGEQVTFIARGEHLQAMRSRGLQVQSILGDVQLAQVQATDDPAQVGPVDAVLLAVKAWQVPAAAQAMRPLVGPQSVVLPLLNGVDAPQQLADALGPEPVLGGLCQISSMLSAPGVIRHVAIEPLIRLGELDGKRSGRVQRLAEALGQAGVKVEVPENIWTAMWQKFTFIVTVSGVGAVLRAPVGVIRSLPGPRQLVVECIAEVVSVGLARGVALPPDLAASTLTFIDNLAPGVSASMQRDILAGKPSELAAQNGAVVRMGDESGIPVPANRFIYASLLPQELRARGELLF